MITKTRLGLSAWVVGFIWFFVAQIIAGAAWKSPTRYSWSWNNVSDLGNARCQMWAEDGHAATYVCSPLHSLMNATSVLEGCCVVFGMLVTGALWQPSLRSKLARTLMGFAGLGLAIAGLAPADLHENIHVVLGALPIALGGNLGLLLTGGALRRECVGPLRHLGPTLGILGLVCTDLFLTHRYLGIGPGGIERLWAYTFLIWTAVIGGYCWQRPCGSGLGLSTTTR
ncbi:MAG TPA: DUF998 domain-containing protein [Gemmatimonadaceae bacterium]|nr:DUF998 domain-containing protein [Gemmatimonadaceae bacterium]